MDFNNGIILQYGRSKNASTITLHVTYSNFCIFTNSPDRGGNNNDGKIWYSCACTLSTVKASWFGSANYSMATYFYYICIGY